MSNVPHIMGTDVGNGRSSSARGFLWLAILANGGSVAAFIAGDIYLEALIAEVAPGIFPDASKAGWVLPLLPGIVAAMSGWFEGGIARWGKGILCVLCGLGGAGTIAMAVLGCNVPQWTTLRVLVFTLAATFLTLFSAASLLYYSYLVSRKHSE